MGSGSSKPSHKQGLPVVQPIPGFSYFCLTLSAPNTLTLLHADATVLFLIQQAVNEADKDLMKEERSKDGQFSLILNTDFVEEHPSALIHCLAVILERLAQAGWLFTTFMKLTIQCKNDLGTLFFRRSHAKKSSCRVFSVKITSERSLRLFSIPTELDLEDILKRNDTIIASCSRTFSNDSVCDYALELQEEVIGDGDSHRTDKLQLESASDFITSTKLVAYLYGGPGYIGFYEYDSINFLQASIINQPNKTVKMKQSRRRQMIQMNPDGGEISWIRFPDNEDLNEKLQDVLFLVRNNDHDEMNPDDKNRSRIVGGKLPIINQRRNLCSLFGQIFQILRSHGWALDYALFIGNTNVTTFLLKPCNLFDGVSFALIPRNDAQLSAYNLTENVEATIYGILRQHWTFGVKQDTSESGEVGKDRVTNWTMNYSPWKRPDANVHAKNLLCILFRKLSARGYIITGSWPASQMNNGEMTLSVLPGVFMCQTRIGKETEEQLSVNSNFRKFSSLT